MIPTYASHRSIPVDFTATSIAGTADAIARNIRIQYVNRAGRSLLSPPQQVTGTGVRVTLHEDLILLGEEVFWVAISVEDTGEEEDAAIVAQWQARGNGQVVRRSFPVDIDLITNEHFIGNRAVTAQNLPSTGMVAGAIAYVVDTEKYYRYDPEAYLDPDGLLRSYGAYTEGFGQWVLHNGINLAYLEGTTAEGGSDVPLFNVENPLKSPPKIGNTDSVPVRYWLNNGDGSPIVDGKFTFEIKVNGLGYTGAFSQKIVYYLRGYVDRDTGIVDTSVEEVGVKKIWTVTEIITLVTDLPQNSAAIVDVVLSFNNDQVVGLFPEQNPEISLNILQKLNDGVELSELANITGSLVFSELDRLLIVPGLKRLSGFGTIASESSQGFIIRRKNQQQIVVEVADTPDQQVVMIGSMNGLTRIKLEEEALLYSEVLRAVISTEPGVSKLVASQLLELNSQGFVVTVTNPVAENGAGIIRADYPDTYLKGNNLGRFTPTKGYIYIDLGGQIYQSQPVDIAGIPSQTFTFTDLGNFTLIDSLPTAPDAEFSLFSPVSVSLNFSSGTITGIAIAYFGYLYQSPNLAATRISHTSAGVIPTLNKSLAEAINDSLARAENLNDLPDVAIARENLNVYSTEEIDESESAQNTAIDRLSAIALLSSKEITELPYTLKPEDHGHELIVTENLSGKIIIPDDITEFDSHYQVLISLDVPGNIEYDREGGNQTDLIFSNGDRFQKSIGEVIVRRRQGTNTLKITGFLE